MTTSIRTLVISLSSLLFATRARAQSAPELAARRSLIEQAESARQAGRHADALAFAERAAQIQLTPSLRLFIAREQLQVGRYASALGNAELCTREATRDESLRNRDEILAGCATVSRDTQARAARLIVTLAPPVADAVVEINDERLPAPALGAPYLVAPGSVRVRARAPGYESFERTLATQGAATSALAIELRSLARPTPMTLRASPAQPTRGPGVGPWITFAFGGAAVLGAGALWLAAATERGGLDALCTVEAPRTCDALSERAIDARVATINALSTASIVVGVAGATGLVWGSLWHALSRPRRDAGPPRATLVPTRDGAMVMVGGVL